MFTRQRAAGSRHAAARLRPAAPQERDLLQMPRVVLQPQLQDAPQRDDARPFVHRRPLQLRLRHLPQPLDRPRARRLERLQRQADRLMRVVALEGQRRAVQVRQRRLRLRERAPQALLVAEKVDVAQVGNVFADGERLPPRPERQLLFTQPGDQRADAGGRGGERGDRGGEERHGFSSSSYIAAYASRCFVMSSGYDIVTLPALSIASSAFTPCQYVGRSSFLMRATTSSRTFGSKCTPYWSTSALIAA